MFGRKTIPAWTMLAFGLLVTIISGIEVKRDIDHDIADQMGYEADHITLQFTERLETYALILRAGDGLFQASDEVTRRDWRSFVEALRLQNRLPGIQGVGFSKWIPADRLANHEARVRAEGFPDYRVWPEGNRSAYSSIVYLEPFRDRNLRAFGYDMYSEPVRREAMDHAADSGESALSGRVQLVQETDTDVQPGVLIYRPVYRQGLPVESVEQRRAALTGWTYMPFRMNDLATSILADWTRRKGAAPHLHIYDSDSRAPGNLLFDDGGPEHGHTFNPFRRQIDFRGRVWLLEFFLPPPSAIQYLPAWIAFGTGTAISVLVFVLMLVLLDRQNKARALADELTSDLRKSEQKFREAETRWRAALEGSGLGVWDWNVPEGRVFFSRRWKAMLGFEDEEIGTGLEEWSSRLHPDDKAETLGRIENYLKGNAPFYISEHRLRAKDGNYIWILDRGMVFERAADGSPLRVVGTHADITERNTIQNDLRRSRAELLEAQRIAHVGNWRLDAATKQVTWSDELYRMFGLDPAQPVPNFTDQHRVFAPQSWQRLKNAVSRAIEMGEAYELELEVVRADGTRCWMLGKGEADRDATGLIVSLRGTALDITARKEAEIQSQRVRKLYDALNACNSAIMRCGTENELFAQLAEIVVSHGGMKMAWVGLVDPATEMVVPVAAHGAGVEYLDGIKISVRADDRRGRGATGTAVREGHAVWIDDYMTDARAAPWQEQGARYGWRASGALPIRRAGKSVGALTFYAAEPAPFSPDIRTLLDEMASQIGFALDKLSAEAELDTQLDELKRWYESMLGRETRILELKREVNEALAKAGQPPRYAGSEMAADSNGTNTAGR